MRIFQHVLSIGSNIDYYAEMPSSKSRGLTTNIRRLVLPTDHIVRWSSLQRLCAPKMREIVHIQAGQCGNQIGAKVSLPDILISRRGIHLSLKI